MATSFNTDFNQAYFKNFERVSISSPKKKKRKHSGDNQQNDGTSINIVDRVLDFSKYKSNTVLYTLCRDWINATTTSVSSSTGRFNKQSKNDFNFDLTNDEISIKNKIIKSLPAPVADNKHESVARMEKKKVFSFNLNEFQNGEQQAVLLRKNVEKWKNVRKESIKNFKAKNERYKESYDILKNIYENI